tara:strand:- start:1254 stop:2363 length:1110 start_codon:yes stop_codon:yes gene_type:complete
MSMMNNRIFAGFCITIIIIVIQGCPKKPPPPTPNQWPKKKVETVVEDFEDYTGVLTEFNYIEETVESSPNAKSVTKITSNNEKDLVIRDPDHHPNSDLVIYTEYRTDEDGSRGTNSTIWNKNPTANARVKVTEGSFSNKEAVFNGDGKAIVFSSARSNVNEGIWRIKSDGLGGILKLTEFGTSRLMHPTIGKDDQVAFHALDPRYKADSDADDDEIRPFIWLMEADGSVPTQLRYGQKPNFSPDGSTIVFTRMDEITERSQMFTMTTNGGRITQLSFNTDYDITDPAWHPNGEYITYASNEGNTDDTDSLGKSNDYNIWIMEVDATNKTQLTTNKSYDDQPVFSPDGDYIYFRSNRGGFWNIWRFEPIF